VFYPRVSLRFSHILFPEICVPNFKTFLAGQTMMFNWAVI
jgi:hypothetical protein